VGSKIDTLMKEVDFFLSIRKVDKNKKTTGIRTRK
jgi:hypothetical protein